MLTCQKAFNAPFGGRPARQEAPQAGDERTALRGRTRGGQPARRARRTEAEMKDADIEPEEAELWLLADTWKIPLGKSKGTGGDL